MPTKERTKKSNHLFTFQIYLSTKEDQEEYGFFRITNKLTNGFSIFIGHLWLIFRGRRNAHKC